jgi:manganese oxidase
MLDRSICRLLRRQVRLWPKAALVALLTAFPAGAANLDYFGPPPAGDPSALTGPYIGLQFADTLLSTLPETNLGSFQGGATGTKADAALNGSIPQSALQANGTFNIPTNSKPSPTFGAQPFTQQMLLFEEFGTEKLDPAVPPPPNPLPSISAGPAALEAFLAQRGIAPFPTQFANTQDSNPWRSEIETFLGRPLVNPPAEGRPPGQGFSHQRWNEFYPQVFFKTAQAGARMNGGFRDSRQMHGYQAGEFGPGGLYYQVYSSSVPGAPSVKGTTNGISARFHPLMPVQDPQALWTFDGTFPPKLLMARYGQPVLMRHYNDLPIDPSANRGFGLHTITTHEHNGHTPAESDGYANAFFFPGQFYDYRWPLQLAGYDTINTTATDPRAAFPCSDGETLLVNNDAAGSVKSCSNGTIPIRGDWRETMSTHWFHDHMLDFTAQNVYKGNAAMMNYYSALDRGNEAVNDGVNLRLPSGTALPWGNRDYDVNLVVADKAWDKDGQLWFNIFNTDGFVGDQLLTNWEYKPYLDVRARRYRFRILNGSVSRFVAVALVQQVSGAAGAIPGPAGSGVSYNRVPFHMIANDGNIMEHAVPFDGSMDLAGNGNPQDHHSVLPTQGIAERYDIVVDFGKNGIKPGDVLYFVNVLEHANGKVTGNKIALEDILSGAYQPQTLDVDGDGVPDQWINGDPCVGKFLELRVKPYAGTDLSMDPADYITGKKSMIPLTLHRDDPVDQATLANARHRSFSFGRSNGTDKAPWTVKTDGDNGYNMDPRRLSAAPQLANGPTQGGFSGDGTLEIWRIELGGGGWSHPVHVHFEEGILLSRGGKPVPEWEKWARKDVYRIGPDSDSLDSVEMAIHFREFAGTYMEHCHNTQHEDNSMLLRWDIERPGQFQLLPTPLPTWDGVQYVDSAALPTFRTGDGFGVNKSGVAPPASTVYLTSDKASPQTTATPITFTAVGAGGSGSYQYRFWVNSGSGFNIVQDYSAANTFVWTPSLPGAFDILVDVRNAGSSSLREAFTKLFFYQIQGAAAATGVTVSSSIPSPQSPGTAITFTAQGQGGSGSYQYRFWINSGTGFSMVQDYASADTLVWTPSAPGAYDLLVDVRNAGSSSLREASTKLFYYQIQGAAATGVTVSSDLSSPQMPGTPITFTAHGQGGSGSYQYRFWINSGTGFTMVQDYDAANTLVWTPSATGAYDLLVDVRSAGSSSLREAFTKLFYFQILPGPATGVTVSSNLSSPQAPGTPITFSASGQGGSGSYQYRFWINSGSGFSIVQDYGLANTLVWTPAAAGAYDILVDVKNNGSPAFREAFTKIFFYQVQ